MSTQHDTSNTKANTPMKRKDINESKLRKFWAEDRMVKEVTSGLPITISDQDIFGTYTELPSGYRCCVARFQSCGAFMAQAERMYGGRLNESKYASGDSRNEWVFGEGESLETTRDIVSKGVTATEYAKEAYDELRKEVNKMWFIDADMDKCTTAKRKRKKAWSGGKLNIKRFNQSTMLNKPMPCFTKMARRTTRPIIKIGLRVNMNGDAVARDFAYISAMCAVLCEKFEMLGYGVEIWGMSLSYYSRAFKMTPQGKGLRSKNGMWAGHMWLLKAGDARLDVQRIMSMGMSGIMRGFNSSLVPLTCAGASIKCGRSAEFSEELCDHLGLDITIERSSARDGDTKGNAERICGKIKETLQPAK